MLSKPISEVAAEYNPDDRCTPSYVRVPAQFPKIKYSGRTPLGEEVLNEAWVSIISGSEDYSFKVSRALHVICCMQLRTTPHVTQVDCKSGMRSSGA